MEVIYCKKWWFPRKKPIEILNEETARNNHLDGEDYTVVLKQNGMESYVVEMEKNDVLVHFMNDNELNYITYAFHKEHNKLFLNAAYYHNYEEEKVIELMVFGFKENGNWEDFPEFGNYTKLLILEREKQE